MHTFPLQRDNGDPLNVTSTTADTAVTTATIATTATTATTVAPAPCRKYAASRARPPRVTVRCPLASVPLLARSRGPRSSPAGNGRQRWGNGRQRAAGRGKVVAGCESEAVRSKKEEVEGEVERKRSAAALNPWDPMPHGLTPTVAHLILSAACNGRITILSLRCPAAVTCVGCTHLNAGQQELMARIQSS